MQHWIQYNKKKKQRVAFEHILSQTRHDFLLTWAFHLDVEKLCIVSAKEFAKGKKRFRLYYMQTANISVSERASKQNQALLVKYKHCHQGR